MFVLLSSLISGFGQFVILMLPIAIFVYLLEACTGLWQYLLFRIMVYALIASLLITKTKIKEVIPFLATIANLYLSIYKLMWSIIKSFFLFIYRGWKRVIKLLKNKIGYVEYGDEGWGESL